MGGWERGAQRSSGHSGCGHSANTEVWGRAQRKGEGKMRSTARRAGSGAATKAIVAEHGRRKGDMAATEAERSGRSRKAQRD